MTANFCLRSPVYAHGSRTLKCLPNDHVRTAIAGDFCDSSLCLNGGTCLMGQDNEIYCLCPEGFTGLVCNETEKGTCSQEPASPVSSQVGSPCSSRNSRPHGKASDFSMWANQSFQRPWVQDDGGREEKKLIWMDRLRLGPVLLFAVFAALFRLPLHLICPLASRTVLPKPLLQ